MTNNQYVSNNDNKIRVIEYKVFCDGRGCNKIATHRLKIFYLRQDCWFCENCRQSLQDDGLVESMLKAR